MTPEYEVILLGSAGLIDFFIPRLACEDELLVKGPFEMLSHPLCIMMYASNRSAISGSSNERKELVRMLSSLRVSFMYVSGLARFSCRDPVATDADPSFASACTYTKIPRSPFVPCYRFRCYEAFISSRHLLASAL